MFGRRQQQPMADPREAPTGVPATSGARPPYPANPVTPGPRGGAVTGWRAFGHGQHESDQIGAYAGGLLTQTPTMLPGLQLLSGTEHVNNRWHQPIMWTTGTSPETRTQRHTLVVGGQRYGSRYTGPIGPANSNRFQANVAEAQLRQSGMGAVSFIRRVLRPSADQEG